MEDIQYVKNRLINIISEFGDGETEFNTKDVNRILDQLEIQESYNEILVKELNETIPIWTHIAIHPTEPGLYLVHTESGSTELSEFDGSNFAYNEELEEQCRVVGISSYDQIEYYQYINFPPTPKTDK